MIRISTVNVLLINAFAIDSINQHNNGEPLQTVIILCAIFNVLASGTRQQLNSTDLF